MELIIANSKHIVHAQAISNCIGESAKMRGTGIARRSPEYISKKMESGNAVIAIVNNEFAGFCYIEMWGHNKYVAHSGLIVSPDHRGKGLAKQIKKGYLTCPKRNFQRLKYSVLQLEKL